MTQAVCNESGLPLYAEVDSDGEVIGITHGNGEPEKYPTRDAPSPAGNFILPLHGDYPAPDYLKIISSPRYSVHADHVERAFVIRDKTAAELLEEISWWWNAMNSRREAQA